MRKAHAVRVPEGEGESSSAGRVPCEQSERWRRALRQARREVAIMRRAGNAAERLTDDAERLINRLTNGRFRPEEAKVKVGGARAQLVQARHHTKALTRHVNITGGWLAAAPPDRPQAQPL